MRFVLILALLLLAQLAIVNGILETCTYAMEKARKQNCTDVTPAPCNCQGAFSCCGYHCGKCICGVSTMKNDTIPCSDAS